MKSMKKFEVDFGGGEARNVFDPDDFGVAFMCVSAENSDGEYVELYAEVPIVGSPFEEAERKEIEEGKEYFDPKKFNKYAYPILKDEIISQAFDNDVNPDLLDFTGYEAYE